MFLSFGTARWKSFGSGGFLLRNFNWAMAVYLGSGLCVSGPYHVGLEKKERVVLSSDVLGSKNEFKGAQVVIREGSGSDEWSPKAHLHHNVHAQTSICVPRALRWWEKGNKPNMIEITSAQDLVDSLLNAGDKLAIVHFYSPGCGGCKTLHPKMCQLAECNPDAIFLEVNYEEHKSMCHSLRIHVLPFFQFYRGAQGRVCSFSCTNATIGKFKAALAKHGTDRCSLGPAKGLEESELLSLASNREMYSNYPLRSSRAEDFVISGTMNSRFSGSPVASADVEDRSALLAVVSMQ